MTRLAPTRRPKPSEQGYILLGVLILLVIFIIAMSVAAPRIAASIQRDRELETMRRGKQYVRAIQLYYRKFNTYPPNMDALVKTNEIRFLRRKYIDPITGKDDWKPIMFGQNKTPMAMGFFGQPLGGTGGAVVAGTGPQGGNGMQGSGMFGSNTGSSGPMGGGIGGSMGGGMGSTMGGGMGSSIFSNSPTDASGQAGQNSQTGQSGALSSTSGSSGTFGNGPTFGGGAIIGVEPVSPKKSILVFKKKDHYNEWEFLYSPLADMRTMGGGNAGTIGQPANGLGGFNGPGSGMNGLGGMNGPGGGMNGPGGGFNGPGGINSPGGGSGTSPVQPTPPTPTPPTPPQQ